MLLKKIFYFSATTTAFATVGPVVAYLTKLNTPTSQEATAETSSPASSSQQGVSNDTDWGTWF